MQLTKEIFTYVCLHPYCNQEELIEVIPDGAKSRPIIEMQLSYARKCLAYLQRIGALRDDKFPHPIPGKINWDNPKKGTLIMMAVVCEPAMPADTLLELAEGLRVSSAYAQQVYTDTNAIRSILISNDLSTPEYITLER